MKQKLITLDDEAFALASKQRNFSQWVRMALKATDTGGLELINPLTVSPMQALSIALNKLQTQLGFEHEVCVELVEVMMKVRKELPAENTSE